MKLVLDTNVLVAAFVAHGACNDLLEHAIHHHEIVWSRPLISELREVLRRKLQQRDTDVRQALALLTARFTLVAPVALATPVCRDPDDDIVLATALTGGCAAIVTGDQDLLILDPFMGIRVLTPAAFWPWEAGPEALTPR
ncbi:MAG TPA: putative toxin-antitoxin system toxin component, PIN family [Terriglobales bacterium]|nr:putative toxin-antitoxin system toxin component, PIN family [Terriglobales bacterium]